MERLPSKGQPFVWEVSAIDLTYRSEVLYVGEVDFYLDHMFLGGARRFQDFR